MSLSQSLRSFLPLVVGLVAGAVGASLFRESLPGEKGTPQERLQKLEVELRDARNRIAELEPAHAAGRSRFGENLGRSMADGTRGIANKLKSGQAVTPDDIFRATKPFIRDLSPLFDRIRIREQKRRIDSITGELARRYNLDAEKQTVLKKWFDDRASEEARRWTELLGRDDTGLEQLAKASRDVRPDEGIEKVMEAILPAQEFAQFKKERLDERARRLEQETDMKVQRLDSLVGLSESQRDQVFGILAKGSRDYDPAMEIVGASGAVAAPVSGNPREAMLSVLTPDQRAVYDSERQRRRQEAEKDLNAIGMTLPANWDMLEGDNF